jgi:hypothetical protein
MNVAIEMIKNGYKEMIDGWRRARTPPTRRAIHPRGG